MIEILIVFVSMTIQDVAAAAKVEFLGRDQPWRAGLCEAVSDVGASLSIGLAGATVVIHKLTFTTLRVEMALALAAVLGTKLGHWLTNRRAERGPSFTSS